MKRILSTKAAAPLIAAGAFLLFTAGCGHTGGTGGAVPGSVLRVGFIGTVGGSPAGPEGWADRQGLLLPLLKPIGVSKITFTAFPNGPDLNEAMAAGALDVGMLGDTPAIVGHAAGIPTRLVNQTAVGIDCWLIVRQDGPKTVEDLKGKVVATQKGSFMARYLLGLLQEKGLSHDVKFVHLMSVDAEPALRRGDVAAVASPLGPLLISHGFRSIDQATQHPGLEGSGVTVVTQSYLDAHPGFPALWNKARAVGIAAVKAHQDEYDALQASRVKLPVNVYRALYPSRVSIPEPLSAHGLSLLNGTKAFLVQQHLAKKDFALGAWAVPGEDPVAKKLGDGSDNRHAFYDVGQAVPGHRKNRLRAYGLGGGLSLSCAGCPGNSGQPGEFSAR